MSERYVSSANLALAFFDMSSRYPDKTLLVDKRDAVWQKQSYQQVAQKVKALCAVLHEMGAKKGDHILEIGCGWGGFA